MTISKHNQGNCSLFHLVINMPLNKEATLVKKMFSHQTSLMNDHHGQTGGVSPMSF